MESSTDLTDPPVLPRRKKIPARFNDGADNHVYTELSSFYRHQFFEVLDSAKGEVIQRFDQNNFSLIRQIEKLLIDASNAVFGEIPESIRKTYADDINFDKLSVQLKMLPDLLQGKFSRVTKLQTLCNVFNEKPISKALLREVHILLKIYLTVPVTTATAERSFSVLRRVKTYLRSSISQQRLNHCMLLYLFKEKIESLNLVRIASQFASRNER